LGLEWPTSTYNLAEQLKWEIYSPEFRDNSPAAKANALVLTEYFNNNDVAMNVSSIVAAAYALKDKLDWKSPAQVEFSEVLARLDPAQCLVANSWLNKQRRLKIEGDEGCRNVNQIVSWLLNRRYAVTEAGMDVALTNVQNNSRRPLFWHEGPKQSREYVQGKPNHAFNNEPPKPATAQSEFHPNGRGNHSYVPPENAAKKPAEAPDVWQQICKLHLKEWVTQGQRPSWKPNTTQASQPANLGVRSALHSVRS
jgi:hypothetical protein